MVTDRLARPLDCALVTVAASVLLAAAGVLAGDLLTVPAIGVLTAMVAVGVIAGYSVSGSV